MLKSLIYGINLLFFIGIFTVISCKSDARKTGSFFGSPDYHHINIENKSRDAWQKPGLVIEALGDISNKTIADIGSGTGYFTFRFAMRAGHVIAIDIDPNMLALIETFKVNLPKEINERVTTKLATPHDPNLSKNEADIAVLINTATYLDQKQDYFKNLHNILPDSGRIMIVDYKQSKMPWNAEQGDYKISPDAMKALLTDVGFEISTFDLNSLEYQYVIVGSKNQQNL